MAIRPIPKWCRNKNRHLSQMTFIGIFRRRLFVLKQKSLDNSKIIFVLPIDSCLKLFSNFFIIFCKLLRFIPFPILESFQHLFTFLHVCYAFYEVFQK
jgi:hypothetical protein